jgi:hypothetical protein
MSEVPDHWIPFLREQAPGNSGRLRRGVTLRADGTLRAAPVATLGRILDPAHLLFDEEAPRSGIKVVRAYRWARGIDGSTHVWIGRRKTTGRGEGTSGLRFDFTERGTAGMP